MSSSNPFGFMSGMFLEIGAVVAVLAILWQPSAGDTRPAGQPDFFASQPVHFNATPATQYEPAARTALVREDMFAYRPLPAAHSQQHTEQPAYSQPQPAYSQQPWRDNERLLPAAPPMREHFPPETRQETRFEAQPYVRTLASDRPTLSRQPQRDYTPPAYRTADGRNGEYYNRY